MLKVRLLGLDDHSKKLVLESRLCDDEVDDGTLGSRLWLVMRVDELGLQVEFEAWGNLNIFGSESDGETSSLLDKLF